MTKSDNGSIAEKADYCSYIDGWRGVAILMVVAIHTSQHFGNTDFPLFLFDSTEGMLRSGARGVQLFFILSAFTLFNSSYRRFKTDLHPKRDFYLRRAFRILPLWFIVIATYCYMDNRPLWAGGLSATFLFGFLRFNHSFEVVRGGWSLFVEETFYLMLPVIFGKITTLRKASNYTIVLIALAVMWAAQDHFFNLLPRTNTFIFFAPPSQWYFFGIGIMLYYIIRINKIGINAKSHTKWKLDLLAFCLIPVVTTIYIPAIGAVFAFCIYVSSIKGTILNRIMDINILKRFGVYCYSIYLLHIILLTLLDPYIKSALKILNMQYPPVELQFCLVFPVIALMSLVIGYCCFNVIEKPSVRLGRFLIKKSLSSPPQPQVEIRAF